MSVDEVRTVACQDLDALEIALGDRAYFMGAQPSSIDATLYACLLQTYATPCNSPVVEYARSKPALYRYYNRLQAQYWAS